MLLSVLLGTDPPRLPTQLLVRTTELFGIAEGTTRTALSRMAAAGEVRAIGGAYELAASRLIERQRRQSASRAARTGAWRGRRWLQAVVTADGRRPAAERAALRSALGTARLAELREGVWLRPDNLGAPPEVGPGVGWFRSVPDGEDAALAAGLWDLGGWASDAASLRRRMDTLLPRLHAGDRRALAKGFVVSAAVLRHFQADPLLPPALLPSRWPGDDLRADYERYDAAYRAVLGNWFREHGP